MIHDTGVPIVQPEIIKETVENIPIDNVEQHGNNPDVPQLDLDPYRLPLRPEEQPEEVPVVVKNVDIAPPSIDLNDDVRKIPIYVSSEEDSAEVSSDGMHMKDDAEKKTESAVPVPSTDLYDDVSKIPVGSANANEDTPYVTEKSEVVASTESEGALESIEATTEAATLNGVAGEDEERTEIPETSTASSA